MVALWADAWNVASKELLVESTEPSSGGGEVTNSFVGAGKVTKTDAADDSNKQMSAPVERRSPSIDEVRRDNRENVEKDSKESATMLVEEKQQTIQTIVDEILTTESEKGDHLETILVDCEARWRDVIDCSDDEYDQIWEAVVHTVKSSLDYSDEATDWTGFVFDDWDKVNVLPTGTVTRDDE